MEATNHKNEKANDEKARIFQKFDNFLLDFTMEGLDWILEMLKYGGFKAFEGMTEPFDGKMTQ